MNQLITQLSKMQKNVKYNNCSKFEVTFNNMAKFYKPGQLENCSSFTFITLYVLFFTFDYHLFCHIYIEAIPAKNVWSGWKALF